MKLYLVQPLLAANSDERAEDARFEECAGRISDLIVSHIETDPALFGMRQAGEAAESQVEIDARYGDIEVARIEDREVLREILRESGRPNSGKWMLVRSLVTCRAVFYGYDGQALVCLPTEAAPITSPDETLIRVEECSHLLAETDWMDGLSLD